VVLFIAVMVVASYILFNTSDFPASVVKSAGAAFFADVLGMLIGVWKIALNAGFLAKAAPVTGIISHRSAQHRSSVNLSKGHGGKRT